MLEYGEVICMKITLEIFTTDGDGNPVDEPFSEETIQNIKNHLNERLDLIAQYVDIPFDSRWIISNDYV